LAFFALRIFFFCGALRRTRGGTPAVARAQLRAKSTCYPLAQLLDPHTKQVSHLIVLLAIFLTIADFVTLHKKLLGEVARIEFDFTT
jgi:hypothetical protein